jgi:hypothetical protein
MQGVAGEWTGKGSIGGDLPETTMDRANWHNESDQNAPH